MNKIAITTELKKYKKQIYNFINNHNIDINQIYKIANKTHDIEQITIYYINTIFNIFINDLELSNSKIFNNDQISYNNELIKLIKVEFKQYADKVIKEKINKLPTLITNIDIINFINDLSTNNDSIGDFTKPIPFDANDINSRDRPLILYQIFNNNNLIEEDVIIGNYSTHHIDYTDRFIDAIKAGHIVKTTFGYVYKDIAFLGNKEANECGSPTESANIIKSKLPYIKKVYYIPDQDNSINTSLQRIANFNPIKMLLTNETGILACKLKLK